MDTFSRIQHFSFFALLIGVSVAFGYLISDFLLPIVWAVILSILFFPITYRMERQFGGRKTPAALLTLLVAVLLVFLPIAGIGTLVVKESTELYTTARFSNPYIFESVVQAIPFATELLSSIGIEPNEIHVRLAEVLKNAGGKLATGALDFGASTIQFVAKALVMLYLLFFFLRDGAAIGSHIMRYLPLGDAKEIFLYEQFASAVRATVKGALLISLAQGAIGTILFLIAGIPSPALWGLLMALCALVPGVGPAIIWLPAGLILLTLGSLVPALVVLIGGTVILGSIDNVLRPILVGRDTNMPEALVLLSVLGGLGLFGISGIILGPALAALFLATWELFGKEYRVQLAERG